MKLKSLVLLLFIFTQFSIAAKGRRNKRKAKSKKVQSKGRDVSSGRRKLMRFFDIQSGDEDRNLILGGMAGGLGGGGGPGGGISTKDGLKINFPKLPPPNKSPITINTPAAAYPTVVTDPRRQKPIVLVHEILEPRIKKRVIVHHRTSFMDQYYKMAHSMNPYYLQMARNNPYYAPFAEASPGYQQMVASPEFAPMMKEAMRIFPSSRGGAGGPGGMMGGMMGGMGGMMRPRIVI